MKKKGKVYPSPPPPSTQQPPQPPPSSSSSSRNLNEDESLSVLRLLPATILVLVSVLSTEDREVLAYLITRGNCCGRASKKNNKSSRNHHKPPVLFDCECFDCYTSYWLRWDSSPNRELIHEIIEAFENHHLSTGGGENSKNKAKRGKKKDKKPGRRVEPVSESHVSAPDNSLPGRLSEAEVAERETRDEEKEEVVVEESTVEIPGAAGIGGHKGLARKVLPDVLGLLNSSFWRLWNPNA